MLTAFFRVLFAAFLLTVTASPIAAKAERISRFEQGWPAWLDGLGLDARRNYVVILQVPPDKPLDNRNAETIRRSITANIFQRARIGHVTLAWQCGAGRGFVSQSGELANQGRRMALAGWGATPLLSTFTDGRLQTAAELKPHFSRRLLQGRGHVIAVEVGNRECGRMRDFFRRFLDHPSQPWRRYGLVPDPARMEGSGCVSLSLALAARAGILDRAGLSFWRRVPVHAVAIGRMKAWPASVIPFARLAPGEPQQAVTMAKLLHGPLDQGDIISHVRVADPELLFAFLSGARAATGTATPWVLSRIPIGGDPLVRSARQAGHRWALTYRSHRMADPQGTRALVLEK